MSVRRRIASAFSRPDARLRLTRGTQAAPHSYPVQNRRPEKGDRPRAAADEASPRPGGPLVCRAIVALTTGDPFGAAAKRVAECLVAQGAAEEAITLNASASPAAVARIADSHSVALILVGAPNAGERERVARAERATGIAAATRHPILLVPASAPWAPKRCVLAMDFGRASISAALLALALLERPAFAAPAFVDTGGGVAPSDRDGVPPAHLRLLFDALPAALGSHAGVTMAPHFLKGARVSTLVAFALTYGAELMAVGRRGRPASAARQSAELGPTVRGLLEHAPCSVLVSSSA